MAMMKEVAVTTPTQGMDMSSWQESLSCASASSLRPSSAARNRTACQASSSGRMNPAEVGIAGEQSLDLPLELAA